MHLFDPCLSLLHLARTKGETDTEYTHPKRHSEKRTERGGESRKRCEQRENAEENEHSSARHALIVSGCYDDDKFSPDGIGMGSKVRLHFLDAA